MTPIFDANVHAMPAPFYATPTPNHAACPFTGEPTTFEGEDVALSRLLAAMDAQKVERAVLNGRLEDVRRWRAAASGRFLSSIMLGGPFNVPVSELAAAHDLGELHALGEVLTQFFGQAFDDPAMRDYYAFAEERGLPVFFRTGTAPIAVAREAGFTGFRIRLGDPLTLEEILIRHPRLIACLTHAGGPFEDNTRALMQTFPNVWADVTALAYRHVMPRAEFHRLLERLTATSDMAARILFATGSLLWPDHQLAATRDSIEEASYLDEAQKQAILHGNARRLFSESS